MATDEGLRYIDSDGHILEHPTAMPEYAPAEYRDRIWHIETDESGEEWLTTTAAARPANVMAAAGVAGMSDEDRARVVPRRDALHGDAPRGLERQGAPPGHGPGRHRPRGAVPHDAARPPERSPTSTSPRPRPRAYNDWCSDHMQEGEGRLVRRRRGPADARTRRRRSASPRRSAAWPSCRAWCRCSCGRTRRSTGGRSTTRSTTRSGRRPRTPGSRSRCTRSSRPTCPARAWACAWRGRASRRQLRRRLRPEPSRSSTSSSRIRSSVRARLFTQAIANPVDVMSCIAYLTRRRRVRALPRREVHLPRGQRRLVGARGSSASTTTARSSSGR